MWRDIPGFPGYQVSSCGQVRSFWHRRGKSGAVFSEWVWAISDTPKLLSIHRTRKGYHAVNLKDAAGKPRVCTVHVLMLEAFIGPRPTKAQARHLDDNRERNTLDNLAWGTASDNQQDAVRNGRCCRARLTPEDVEHIRTLLAEGATQSAVARLKNVTQSAISRIATGARWKTV